MTLLSPGTQSSRPITDRVKESLFDVLYNYELPGGAVVADLFCGVGSLGLEALSRGAKSVTFVEKDERILATLKKNIERAGFHKQARVVRANAFAVGAALGSAQEKCNLVFVDPPYAATENVQADSALAGLLDVLGEQVTEDVMVIVRTSRDVSLLDRYGRFCVAQRRQWGTMAVTILTKAEDTTSQTTGDTQEDDEQAGGNTDH